MASPVSTGQRVESLDVLRGFALLGILLLNILGFGLHSAGYFNPLIGIGETELSRTINLTVWGTVSVLFEGAMRCLFSILFGAGVLLFTTGAGAKSALLHYKRTFWLLMFGIFNAYILLWNGDILITYALCGFALYLARNWSVRALLTAVGVLVVAMTVFYTLSGYGLAMARDAGDPSYQAFAADFLPSDADYQAELDQRRDGYRGAFAFNFDEKIYMTLYILPVYFIWDALAMMMLGMALYKMQILNASRSFGFYTRLMVAGFAVGLSANLSEVWRAVSNDFDLLASIDIVQGTYQIGRIGMGLGYLALVMLVCKAGALPGLRMRLAAVGRMALTNYLMHSAICLFIFTGAGFGMVGVLERWHLYLVVAEIWILQLWFSPWWLARYRYGPLEWLWRTLTYGKVPVMALKPE